MVKEFHARNRYACYTKNNIQEKEKELKRDYKMLKEAQRQSGCSWNKDRFMIEGGPHLWNNLIVTFPKIKKFCNPKASFSLFDALGELYDGHLAEGNYNFTSFESPQEEELLRQIPEVEDEIQDLDDILEHGVEDEDTEVHMMEDDDASVQMNEDMLERRVDSLSRDEESEASASAQRTGQQRRVSAAPRNKKERESNRPRKSVNIEGMMERYLEMRTKQAEDEAAQLAKEKESAQGSDFSIQRCISVLNMMEVTKEERSKLILSSRMQKIERFFCVLLKKIKNLY